MKNKSKAFTLIELLAVISILGIITTVAIISVNRVIQKNRENYYISQEKMIKLAGENYISDNKSILPKSIGLITKITLGELKSKNYISEVVDYKKKACDLNNSYILVYKKSRTRYKYYTYLDCPDYQTKSELRTDENFDINFTYNDLTNGYNPKSVTVDINSKYNIESYQYVIYKNNKEIYNSENIKNNNKKNKKQLEFTIKLEKYKYGEYKIVVTAINEYGTFGKKSSKMTAIDNTPPSCNTYIYTNGGWQQFNNDLEWTNNNRRIKVECIDNESGCTTDENDLYKIGGKIYQTDTSEEKIVLTDNAGNTSICSFNVNIDKTAPSCGETYVYTKSKIENEDNISSSSSQIQTTETWNSEISTASLEWTKEDRIGKVLCSDNGSGCEQELFTEKYTDNEIEIEKDYITIRDKVGNETNCPLYIKVDKKSPTCGQKQQQTFGARNNKGEEVFSDWSELNQNTNWTKNKRNISIECIDNGSGCKENPKICNLDYCEGCAKEKDKYLIYDNVGNKTECETYVKIDKKSPTCGDTTGESAAWTNTPRTIEIKCNDSHSGCRKTSYSKVFDGTTPTKAGTIKIYDKTSNSNDCSVNAYVDNQKPSTPIIYKIDCKAEENCEKVEYTCTPNVNDNGVSNSDIICNVEVTKKDANKEARIDSYYISNDMECTNNVCVCINLSGIAAEGYKFQYLGGGFMQLDWGAKKEDFTCNDGEDDCHISVIVYDNAGNHSSQLIEYITFK